jgi:hypothetical protein
MYKAEEKEVVSLCQELKRKVASQLWVALHLGMRSAKRSEGACSRSWIEYFGRYGNSHPGGPCSTA